MTQPAAAPVLDDDRDQKREFDRIHKTFEKHLASVQGLNHALVKKIRKCEAQISAVLAENKALEEKNALLIDQLGRANDQVGDPTIGEEQLPHTERALAESKKALAATELALERESSH